MPTVPTTIVLPMLLHNFDHGEVLPPFKVLEYYWDCCIVGNAIQTVLRKIGYLTFFLATELIKFGFVLFLAYLMASGIFQLWGTYVYNEADKSSNREKSFAAEGAEVTASYPFVVDLPANTSDDSVKQRKSKDKTRRSSSNKDDSIESPRNSVEPPRNSVEQPRNSVEAPRNSEAKRSSDVSHNDSPRTSVKSGAV